MYQNSERTNISDSMFHFLILETINYILKKDIETKKKLLVF
jgi:hypothetical protein